MDLRTLIFPDLKDKKNIRNLSHLDQITEVFLPFYKCCRQAVICKSEFSTAHNRFFYTKTFCNCPPPPYLKAILDTDWGGRWMEITITIHGKYTMYNHDTRQIQSTKKNGIKPLCRYEWGVQAEALYRMLINFKSKALQNTNFIMIFEKQENGFIHSHIALNMEGLKMGVDEFTNDLKKYLKSKTKATQHSVTALKSFVKWYKYIFKNVEAYDYIRNNGDKLRAIVEENKIKYIDNI